MGLFDFFKKKDAVFYLNRAKQAVEQERWVAARDDAIEGLRGGGASDDVIEELQKLRNRANEGIFQLNVQEAEMSCDTGDFQHAYECLDTARTHAHSDEQRSTVDTLRARVKEARAESRKKSELLHPGQVPDFATEEEDEENELLEEFEVYLSSLERDIAELYAEMGRDFAEGYIALNAGQAKSAMDFFEKVEPKNEVESAMLAFEKARALLAMEQAQQALIFLDVTAAIRGSRPIFVSDHPSIPYLRFEAFMMLRKPRDAADALREGLKSNPNHPELRANLAGLLIALKELDEAEELVSEHMSCSVRDPQAHVLRAQLQIQKNDKEGALQTLEAGIKNCGCNPSAVPNPMLVRPLADLLLEMKKEPARVETLLSQLFRAQQGHGEWFDYFLRARFLKWQGDEESARVNCKKALAQLPERDPRRTQVEGLFPA